jgi:hypothetical protein
MPVERFAHVMQDRSFAVSTRGLDPLSAAPILRLLSRPRRKFAHQGDPHNRDGVEAYEHR